MDSEVTHCETQHDRLDAMFRTRNRVSTTYTPLEAWVRLHMVQNTINYLNSNNCPINIDQPCQQTNTENIPSMHFA